MAEKFVRMFTCELTDFWVQADPDALNFTTTTDLGNTRAVCVPMVDIAAGGVELAKLLARQGVKVDPVGERYVKEYLMAWMTKLHEEGKARSSLPFGWLVEKGKRVGFVYGGTVYRDDGTEKPAGFADMQLRRMYSPVGALDPWLDACNLITDQKRPELDCIVASSFAAPLMVTTGEYSTLLSAWGDSGAGKTTAVKVAQSVWSHPKKTKEVTMSTARSVVHKMGEIHNLPIYWDEIKNKKSQVNVFDTFFTGSEGVGPSRLNSNIELRDRGDWQTLLIICSNISFVDHVVSEQKTTVAGMYRVFEYEISKALPSAPGQINAMDASRITQLLENNYGVVGAAYSKWLGSDPDRADNVTLSLCHDFGAQMQSTKEERFWVALCGTLLAGAHVANTLGAMIDIPAMRKFLTEAYDKNRRRMTDEATAGGTLANTESALTGFLKAVSAETIWTDSFPTTAGKPKVVTLLSGLQHSKACQVQWAVDDRLLRISRDALTKYMEKENRPSRQILNGLHDHFQARVSRSVLGSGTQFRSGREFIVDIPVPFGSSLEAQMDAHKVVA
jgi:Domain of unknown function (DUF927)